MAKKCKEKWSSEDDENLISCVQEHPSLWNSKEFLYRNTAFKNNLWKTIDSRLFKPQGASEKRFLSLRRKLGRYINDEKLASRSGSAANNHRPWHLSGKMVFLRESFRRRKPHIDALKQHCTNATESGALHPDDDELQATQSYPENENVESASSETNPTLTRPYSPICPPRPVSPIDQVPQLPCSTQQTSTSQQTQQTEHPETVNVDVVPEAPEATSATTQNTSTPQQTSSKMKMALYTEAMSVLGKISRNSDLIRDRIDQGIDDDARFFSNLQSQFKTLSDADKEKFKEEVNQRINEYLNN